MPANNPERDQAEKIRTAVIEVQSLLAAVLSRNGWVNGYTLVLDSTGVFSLEARATDCTLLDADRVPTVDELEEFLITSNENL